jgi:hypothetical protein
MTGILCDPLRGFLCESLRLKAFEVLQNMCALAELVFLPQRNYCVGPKVLH